MVNTEYDRAVHSVNIVQQTCINAKCWTGTLKCSVVNVHNHTAMEHRNNRLSVCVCLCVREPLCSITPSLECEAMRVCAGTVLCAGL